MKVSNLYIAQVKAKYGIIERENYNKPKSDDSRQPKCPKAVSYTHLDVYKRQVVAIVEGGRDYEVTVQFDTVGIKKMFASFAKLKKL